MAHPEPRAKEAAEPALAKEGEREATEEALIVENIVAVNRSIVDQSLGIRYFPY